MDNRLNMNVERVQKMQRSHKGKSSSVNWAVRSSFNLLQLTKTDNSVNTKNYASLLVCVGYSKESVSAIAVGFLLI